MVLALGWLSARAFLVAQSAQQTNVAPFAGHGMICGCVEAFPLSPPTTCRFVKRFWQKQKNSIISFFQHYLTFIITSITFYYFSNKKITTKQKFLFFYTKHSYIFTFKKKKKKILTFFFTSINFCYSIKPKPKRNRLPNQPNMPTRCLVLFLVHPNTVFVVAITLWDKGQVVSTPYHLFFSFSLIFLFS
jgi:hypothetical protein